MYIVYVMCITVYALCIYVYYVYMCIVTAVSITVRAIGDHV